MKAKTSIIEINRPTIQPFSAMDVDWGRLLENQLEQWEGESIAGQYQLIFLFFQFDLFQQCFQFLYFFRIFFSQIIFLTNIFF